MVYGKNDTIHIARFIRGQESDSRGKLPRLSDISMGGGLKHAHHLSQSSCVRCRSSNADSGTDPARADRVTPDALLAVEERNALRQSNHAMFRNRIGGTGGTATQPCL